LTDAVSNTSGLNKATSASLLALAGSYVANFVSRQATSAGGFNASSLASLLGTQGANLASLAPGGLAQLLGVSSWSDSARILDAARHDTTPAAVQPARAYERPEERGGLGWLKWALPLLLIALALWAWRSSPSPRDVVGTTGSIPTSTVMTKRAVCGRELDIAESGVEAKLMGFVDDKSRAIDDKTWFTFDRLEFETGSATIGPGSRAQIGNIAEIMKCYPTLSLKVGGYTDSAGDPAANLRLSQQRAENTVQAIVASGVSASRLSAEGYGQQFPVASNDTVDGRQRNRRIDLRVTQR
jgi:outer membrane protein OmpA-like peptidoglycan-associated protein